MVLTVSIVINNFNYGRFLKEAIDSALAQTYPYKEVIVVDDGSTDNSKEIIKSYGLKIQPLFKKNGGQASAFNAGFNLSKGDLILFLDADDRLHPTACEKAALLWKNDIVRIQFDMRLILEDGTPQGMTYLEFHHQGRCLSGDFRPLLFEEKLNHIATSGNVFSRSVLKAIMPLNEEDWKICADTPLVVKTPFYGKILSLNIPLADYRIHSGNAWFRNGIITSRDYLRHLELTYQTQRLLKSYEDASGYKLKACEPYENTRILWKAKLIHRLLEGGKDLKSHESVSYLVKQGMKSTWAWPYPFFNKLWLMLWFPMATLIPKSFQAKWLIRNTSINKPHLDLKSFKDVLKPFLPLPKKVPLAIKGDKREKRIG